MSGDVKQSLFFKLENEKDYKRFLLENKDAFYLFGEKRVS